MAARSNGKTEREFAFFGGSFTAVPRAYMLALLQAVQPYLQSGAYNGIRISTRPDAVDAEILALLKQYGVTAIELGAQSMQDGVLRRNGRGHTARQVAEAAERISAAGFSLGLQMMTGLDGDTPVGCRETAVRLAALEPETMRIYPAIVMEGTELARRWRAGMYEPMSLECAVNLCADLLDFFEQRQIRVIRLGLHASPELERDRAWPLASGIQGTVRIPAAAETDGSASAHCPPGAGRVPGESSLTFESGGTEKIKCAIFADDGLRTDFSDE